MPFQVNLPPVVLDDDMALQFRNALIAEYPLEQYPYNPGDEEPDQPDLPLPEPDPEPEPEPEPEPDPEPPIDELVTVSVREQFRTRFEEDGDLNVPEYPFAVDLSEFSVQGTLNVTNPSQQLRASGNGLFRISEGCEWIKFVGDTTTGNALMYIVDEQGVVQTFLKRGEPRICMTARIKGMPGGGPAIGIPVNNREDLYLVMMEDDGRANLTCW